MPMMTDLFLLEIMLVLCRDVSISGSIFFCSCSMFYIDVYHSTGVIITHLS